MGGYAKIPILNAFKDAVASGAQVSITYEAGQRKVKGILKDTSTTKGNREAITNEGLHAPYGRTAKNAHPK